MPAPRNALGIGRIVVPGPDNIGEKHIGMAIILGMRHVMTCCHVLNDALSRQRLEPERPKQGTSFLVRFPYFDDASRAGTLVAWGLELKPTRDIAVIELEEDAPREAGVAVFSEDAVQRGNWYCSGWSMDGAERETRGKFGPVLARGEIQLYGPQGIEPRIAPGYSGAPVLSERLGAFVGMVVTKDREEVESGLAYAIPTAVLREVWPNLSLTPKSSSANSLMRPDQGRRRNETRSSADAIKRTRFRNDVEEDVAGRLQASIHRVALEVKDGSMELGVRPAPEATWSWKYKDLTSSREYQTVGEAFEFFGRRMLLLGEPGSGKSTTLLFIAQKLLAEAKSEIASPIPLLINLSQFHADPPRSSWLDRLRGRREEPTEAGHRQFENWLIRTVAERAGVRRDVAGRWITEGGIAFLLDGLDEVHESYRAKLAAHLNEVFLFEQPHAVVVVGCRVNEYLPLQDSNITQSRLSGGVVLQPLSPAQVDAYLHAARAIGLREALPGDSALQEMAQTPLTLSMMTLAYSGIDASNFPPGLPLSGRRHHLMEAYVAKMLQRKEQRDKHPHRPFDDDSKLEIPESAFRYSPTRVKRYLGWLAVRLSVRMRNAFSPRHFYDLLSEDVERDHRGSLRFGLAIARASLGLLGICLLSAFVVPRTLESVRFACATGFVSILVAVVISDRLAQTENARSLIGGILDRIAAWVAIAMGLLALGVFARALDVTIPGESNPYAIGITLTLFVVASLAAGVENAGSKRWSSALLLLMSASVPAGVLSAQFFLPLEMRLAVPSVMASAIGIWWLARHIFKKKIVFDEMLRGDLFLIWSALLCLAISVTTLDWRWTFAALTTVALGSLFFRQESSALYCGVLLAAAAGNFAGGLAGSILAAGAFLLMIMAISRWTKLHDSINNIWEFFENSTEPAVHGLCESKLLSPIATKAVSLTGELPVRFGSFLEYATDALLLKRSAGNVEFMHRTLRDYFALREILPRLNAASDAQRLEAARSLGYQGESSLPWLADLLHDTDPLVRAAAASGLGMIASPESPPLIELALADTDPTVRKAGVLDLLNLRGDDQRRLSLVMIEEKDPSVLSALLEVLMDYRMNLNVTENVVPKLFANVPETREFARTIATLVQSTRLVGQEKEFRIPQWTSRFWPDLLGDPDSAIRAGAAKCTRLLNQQDVAPVLIRLLASDPNHWVRAEAAKAIGFLHGERAVLSLTRALADRDDYVRSHAVDALRHVGGGQVIEPLIRALADRHENVRSSAFKALGDLDGVEATEPLIRALSDRRWRVREGAAKALAWRCNDWFRGYLSEPRFGPERLRFDDSNPGETLVSRYGSGAVGFLILALSDRKEHVRVSAATSLGRLDIVGAAEPSFRSVSAKVVAATAHVSQTLGRLGGGPMVDSLIRALSDRKAAVRASAAEALGLLGQIRAKEPLARAMRDRSEIVRFQASKALGHFGDPRAFETLLASLSNHVSDSHQDEKAIEMLAQYCDPRAVPFLVDRLIHNRTKIQIIAAQGLACIQDPIAVKSLINLLGHENPSVSTPAAKALASMGDLALSPLRLASSEGSEPIRAAAREILRNIEPTSG